MCITQDWYDNRIQAIQALIDAYEDLALQLTLDGALITYTLDTGQTRQVVTKESAIRLTRELPRLYNMLATLCARRTGSNVMSGRPAW